MTRYVFGVCDGFWEVSQGSVMGHGYAERCELLSTSMSFVMNLLMHLKRALVPLDGVFGVQSWIDIQKMYGKSGDRRSTATTGLSPDGGRK